MPRLPRSAAPTRAPSVLDRILSVLDAVKTADSPVSVVDIASSTGIPKSSAARLVNDLIAQRYLTRDARGVTLGMRLFELGARAAMPRRLVEAAAPVVHELAHRTGERIALWTQQGTDMVSLATEPGRLPMLPTRVGMRSPALTTASGKAFLAFCDDPFVVDRVSAPLVDDAADRFRSELSTVRSAILALDPGESYRGVLAMASPILAADRSVIGAISVAGPSHEMAPEHIAPLVRAAGVSLSRRVAAA